MKEKTDKGYTTTAPKRVYLQSLGCPKNLVDSEIMSGTLAAQGHELTTDRSAAEVIIVNTCGFLQASARESIDAILDLAKEKKEGNCQRLVVTGCLPQRYQGELPKALPEVDLFIGTNDYAKIAELVQDPPDREYIHKPLYVHHAETPRLLATATHTAYVKIAEGCNHTCSFCIIPTLRGRQRSRPIDDITQEVKNLIDQGCFEFNLIAQDSTDYGRDLRDGTSIERLLKALSSLPGRYWFRLLYAYPLSFSQELIESLAAAPNICRYIDIPFQHINDRILKSMHRGSNGHYIRSLVKKLRHANKKIAIRSTFIVGYPGESNAEFEELVAFLQESELDRVGVFEFSVEPGTKAAALPHQIPEATKEERRNRAMEIQQGISLKKNRQKIGARLDVLVEEVGRDGSGRGRSEADAPEIDGCVQLSGDRLKRGHLTQAIVTNASAYDLTAVTA